MLFTTPPDPDKLNVLCFPYAGGNADFYNRWNPRLPDDICFHAVQLPGRGKHIELPLIGTMELLITLLMDELTLFRHCRVALLGTSMGGWIAFQLAQHLQMAGHCVQPQCLILCSTAHPDYRVHLPDLSGLDRASAIERLGIFNPGCLSVLGNPELADIFLPILRADLNLCRRWRFQARPVLSCDMLAYHGASDRIVDYAMMPAWSTLTRGVFTLDRVHGDHFFTERPEQSFLEHLKKNLTALHSPLAIT
ncbi:thioesterase [Pseudomonas sp. S75]|uniref:thioesterase II family protein n=1 Tax=unclassified Pseudomonas TaxID=196821 RepID=UPI001903ADC6|nr:MULTISPECIES: alpha/beta fold hydrolase [unclassified Pseudomonas]MBJ9975367.1 thioesterase [Pseudomonas sp. S30]MBK0152659.1 thioesterase [Pseudomonas sp. S75]